MRAKASLDNPFLECVKKNDTKTLLHMLGCNTIDTALIVLIVNYSDKDYCTKIANFLLDLGANPNVIAYCNNIKIAKVLLARGADINLVGHFYPEETLLHFAIRESNLSLIKFALENGADFNVKNKSGISALKYLDTLQPQSKFKELKLEILILFAPYIINNNQKEKFIFILHEIMDSCFLKNATLLNKIDITSLTQDACKNCILWSNELLNLELSRGFSTENKFKAIWDLRLFIHKLINRLYPGLINAIDEITVARNFIYIKKALLSESTVLLGLAGALNSVIDLYQAGLIDTLTSEKIRNLRAEMKVVYKEFSAHKKEISLSEEDKKMIQQLVQPLHQALMSCGGDYQETLYKWNCKRLEKLSDIEEFPVKNKIKQIQSSHHWTDLSLASTKNSNGKTKVLLDLHKAQDKASANNSVKDFAELKFNI